MEGDIGKLFVGGISWETNENRLKEYFGKYGEVAEAVIMRDRITGRARGFGFVVFAVPADAEKVVMEKHIIDGRVIEAKRAVPREDQLILSRNTNNPGFPDVGRVKKIFVGGLASTVTEYDFKSYFDQFGTITDVVVMYDLNTQRPRGFGFITYDSEEAVDRVLYKTFHELNGKMVEVKRAIPKELSPNPTRSPLVGLNNYSLIRSANFMNNNGYPQGYEFNSVGGYGRLNLIAGSGRSGFPPFGTVGYGMNTNIETGFSASHGNNPNFGNSSGRVLSPYFNGNVGRYSNSSIGRHDSLFSSPPRNVLSGSFNDPYNNSPMNRTNSAAFMGGANFGALFGANVGGNWNSSPLASQTGGSASGYGGGNQLYNNPSFSNYAMGSAGYGRNIGADINLNSPFSASNGGLGSSYGDLYRGSSGYGDSTWAAPELDGVGSLGFGLANAGQELAFKTSEGHLGRYGVANRQTYRGVTA